MSSSPRYSNRQVREFGKATPERELVTEYLVGRNTLREAMNGLKALGLLEVRAGSGTRIKRFDSSSVVAGAFTNLLMSETVAFHRSIATAAHNSLFLESIDSASKFLEQVMREAAEEAMRTHILAGAESRVRQT